MPDRLLDCEFPPLLLNSDPLGNGYIDFSRNYRYPNTSLPPTIKTIFIYDTVIDLQGYQMKDMTAFFRQSFEQRGILQSVQWDAYLEDPLTPFDAGIIEVVLVTSVPLTDDNLVSTLLNAPGFAGRGDFGIGFQPATLNREHVIHGRTYLYGLDTTFGTDSLINSGAGYIRTLQEYDYSSLEPTAVDKLYCYRMFSLSDPSDPTSLPPTAGYNQAGFSPVRVLLDAKFTKEATIPYFMRLKRGYELANQV